MKTGDFIMKPIVDWRRVLQHAWSVHDPCRTAERLRGGKPFLDLPIAAALFAILKLPETVAALVALRRAALAWYSPAEPQVGRWRTHRHLRVHSGNPVGRGIAAIGRGR